MSRLIVKNLPNKVTVDHLKEVFGQKGEVTDVQLKYTKDGKFRNFGFIGYRTEEQAEAAREYFDGTCIRSMKIVVQVCSNLGDDSKPRAWSKYAADSTAYRKLHKDEIEKELLEKREQKQKRKLEKNKDKIKELLKKHKDDPLFTEFIEAHVNENTAWIKEALTKAANSDDDNDSGLEEGKDTHKDTDEDGKEKNIEGEKKKQEKAQEKVANKEISDLEYMKLLMKKVGGETTQEVQVKDDPPTPKKVRNRQLFTVKITGLPYKCKKKDIKEFFRPLVPYTIRLPLGKGKKMVGFCFVGFRTEQELKKALIKDKLFLGNHRVHVQKYVDKAKMAAQQEEENVRIKNQQNASSEESIGESGSIFVRNLPYVLSEQELTSLFEKYGPLAEVNMPIDPISRQPKGFATVTFVIPENAVRAYSELDGTAFSGRMLHLLPAKSLKEEDTDDEGLSFKEKKAKKLKSQAKSSHNWNALFLGANAVADVVAANYDTTKQQLLNDKSKNTSAAVRLALGETQLVNETRAFLENNGVFLEAFNKPAKRRSKTCIIVKNLPANTDKDEIKVLFAKHGQIARFLMPKHGITSLVDFVEPFEAKKAFTKLAYSQFKTAPLYLEWAPENVFTKSAETTDNNDVKTESDVTNNVTENIQTNGKTEDVSKKQKKNSDKSNDKAEKIKTYQDSVEEDSKVEPEDDIEPETDTTLFVKNLNFKTNEDNLKRHFSECGKIHSVTIAKKKDPKNPGQSLSMGYGFVRYYTKRNTNEALKTLQGSMLDGKTLELKRSERGNTNEVKTSKKHTKNIAQNGTKILARNVPFQANSNELHEIFRAFGEIKTLRLPKKLTPGAEQHRGFAFVDYYSKTDAKTAFDSLCQSTHLYGRRLVLEWADQTEDGEDVAALRKRTAQAFHSKTPGGKKTRKGAVDADTFVDGE